MHIRVIGVQELAAELVCLSTLSEKCKLHSEKYHWQSTISRPTIVNVSGVLKTHGLIYFYILLDPIKKNKCISTLFSSTSPRNHCHTPIPPGHPHKRHWEQEGWKPSELMRATDIFSVRALPSFMMNQLSECLVHIINI